MIEWNEYVLTAVHKEQNAIVFLGEHSIGSTFQPFWTNDINQALFFKEVDTAKRYPSGLLKKIIKDVKRPSLRIEKVECHHSFISEYQYKE